MKIEDLKLFMLVVELEGFSAAGDALNLPRSNVSRRINDLEKELGTKLLTRTTRQLALTPTGQDYYQNLQNILPQLDHAHNTIRTQSHTPSGKIKIGLLNETDILLHDLLYKFLEEYPNIELETHLSSIGYHDILNHGLDACIHIGAIKDNTFVARPIATFTRKLYASPGYIRQYGMPQTLEDLHQHFLVALRWPDGRLEDIWKFNHQHIQIKSRLITNSSYYLRHAIFNGGGIGLLPEIIMEPFVKEQKIINVLPEYDTTYKDTWLVYPSRKGQSYAARLFINFALKELRKKYQ